MIVLDLGEKFNDVLFVSRNTASLVERSTVIQRYFGFRRKDS